MKEFWIMVGVIALIGGGIVVGIIRTEINARRMERALRGREQAESEDS